VKPLPFDHDGDEHQRPDQAQEKQEIEPQEDCVKHRCLTTKNTKDTKGVSRQSLVTRRSGLFPFVFFVPSWFSPLNSRQGVVA
jgi:hypothetical protein